MLCEKCQKNEATTHIKKVINGKVTEIYLCSDCAANEGFSSHIGFESTFSDMLSSILGDTAYLKSGVVQKRCECCNSTFSDILESGRLGCSECYQTFFDELLPYLKRVHGNIQHIGKALPEYPQSGKGEPSVLPQNTAEKLKDELKTLIAEEKFEQAAIVRDKIKALEEEGK